MPLQGVESSGTHAPSLMKHSKFVLVAALATVFTAQAEENTGWQTSAQVNVSVNKGNSDTLLAGGSIMTLKKWDKNEFTAKADAVYGNNRDQTTGDRTTTAQNYGVGMQYNRLVTDRFFFLGVADARQDRVADIKYRVTFSPGVGYYVIKNERTTLSFEAGPGLVLEQFENQPSQRYFTIRLGEKFTHKFNDRVRLVQDLDFTPQVDNFSNYVINASATVEADLTTKLSTTVTLSDTYRGEPAPGRKANDLRLLAGIKYRF
jgi:putative salt-induced outer membrane protein YdiY